MAYAGKLFGDVPAAAPPRRVRGKRSRPGHGPADRAQAWRTGLGRVRAGCGSDVLSDAGQRGAPGAGQRGGGSHRERGTVAEHNGPLRNRDLRLTRLPRCPAAPLSRLPTDILLVEDNPLRGRAHPPAAAGAGRRQPDRGGPGRRGGPRLHVRSRGAFGSEAGCRRLPVWCCWTSSSPSWTGSTSFAPSGPTPAPAWLRWSCSPPRTTPASWPSVISWAPTAACKSQCGTRSSGTPCRR